MTILTLLALMLTISLGSGQLEKLSIDNHDPKCLLCGQSKIITFKSSLTFRSRSPILPDHIFIETFERVSIYDTKGFWEEYCMIFLHSCFKRDFEGHDCDCRVTAPFRVQIKFNMLNLVTLATKSLRLRWTKQRYITENADNFLISPTYNLSVILSG